MARRMVAPAILSTLLIGFAAVGNAQTTVVGIDKSKNMPTAEDQLKATPAAPPAPTTAPAQASAAPGGMAKLEDRQEPEMVIRKGIGEEHFMPIQAARISVSNPAVISALVLQDQSGVIVTTKSQGNSDLRIFGNDGRVRLFRFLVVGHDIDDDLKQLRELISGIVGLTASRIGDNLVVSGRIITPEDQEKFKHVKEHYNVIDMVDIKIESVEQDRLMEQLKAGLKDRNLTTINANIIKNSKGEQVVWLTGVAYTDSAKAEAERLAAVYFEKMLNQIELQKPMIEVDCVAATVDYSRLDKRGSNIWNQLNQFEFGVGPIPNASDATATQVPDDFIATGGLGGSTGHSDLKNEELSWRVFPQTIRGAIRMEKGKDYITYYADQHQTVLSGESANFQDGSTIYVQLEGSEAVGLAQIETGFQADVTPKMQENGKIQTKIAMNYSASRQVDASETFQGGGGGDTSAGTMTVKKFKSTSSLECDNGQTIVVAGLDSNLFGQSKSSATPLLEKVPVLNLIFKAQDRNGKNVRSFFFLTPTGPTLFEEANRKPFSDNAPKAKEYYNYDSRYREGGFGFYLGWQGDHPALPKTLPANPEDSFKAAPTTGKK